MRESDGEMGLGFLGGDTIRYMKAVIKSRRMVNEIELVYIPRRNSDK